MDIKKFIIDNLSIDSIVIEAGACDGYDTLFFSNHLTNGKIYSFEPIKSMYLQTLDKISNRENVILENLALSENFGERTMEVADRFGVDWGSHSFLKPKEHLRTNPDITFNRTEIVNCINLDEYILKNSINRIDMMWLDMQGYEPNMIMSSPISLNMTKFIYTEVNLTETYEKNILYKDYRKFLEDSGFEIIFEDLQWVDSGNVLFKKLLK